MKGEIILRKADLKALISSYLYLVNTCLRLIRPLDIKEVYDINMNEENRQLKENLRNMQTPPAFFKILNSVA